MFEKDATISGLLGTGCGVAMSDGSRTTVFVRYDIRSGFCINRDIVVKLLAIITCGGNDAWGDSRLETECVFL